jgi:hypothetical protein
MIFRTIRVAVSPEPVEGRTQLTSRVSYFDKLSTNG